MLTVKKFDQTGKSTAGPGLWFSFPATFLQTRVTEDNGDVNQTLNPSTESAAILFTHTFYGQTFVLDPQTVNGHQHTEEFQLPEETNNFSTNPPIFFYFIFFSLKKW